ncbi:hypothetical protein [Providencia sp. Je.9.19]|uniref:hypothetical protein n=1 Tax=Providencia sp. Je.9.19 TaxID=3142844 RepID=UPI003DAA11CA
MIKQISLGVFLLLPIVIPKSYATIVLTSIEARGGKGLNSAFRDYKITWIRVPGPLDNEVIPSQVRYFGAYEFHDFESYFCDNGVNGYYSGVAATKCISTYPTDTWKQVEEKWITINGNTGPGIVGHQSASTGPVSECVVVAGANSARAVIHNRLYNNGELVCTYAPPTPDPQCYIDSDVTFDFGAVAIGNSIDKKLTKSVSLICNYAANVRLNDARGKEGIITFPWGEAHTTVNERKLPVDITASAGNTTITFEASITGIPNIEGEFSEFYPLIVGYN